MEAQCEMYITCWGVACDTANVYKIMTVFNSLAPGGCSQFKTEYDRYIRVDVTD